MDFISSACFSFSKFTEKKNESCLIKIKWSELTSHFPLHLRSICFQIGSAGSIFFLPRADTSPVQIHCIANYTEASSTFQKIAISLMWEASLLYIGKMALCATFPVFIGKLHQEKCLLLPFFDWNSLMLNLQAIVLQAKWSEERSLIWQGTWFASCLYSIFRERVCLAENF